MPVSQEVSSWRWEGMGHIWPQIPRIDTYIMIAAASVCNPITSKVAACHQPVYVCHSVISSPGGDLCSACKSKQGDHDSRLLRFCPNLPTFSHIQLSSFKYLPEDVEHRWTRCSYMRELQVFLRLDQAPDEAFLQTSSLKHDTVSCWAMAGLVDWGPCEPPHCTCSNESPIQLLLIPGCAAGAPQKPSVVCFTPADPPELPVGMNTSPFHGSWLTVACLSLFLLCVVSALPFCPTTHSVSDVFMDCSILCLFLPPEIQVMPQPGSPCGLPSADTYIQLITRLTHGLTHKVRYLHALTINWAYGVKSDVSC